MGILDVPQYYCIPDSQKEFVQEIKRLGMRHYKVTLNGGWCFKDNGVHSSIVENYKLFSAFDEITICGCLDCCLKGYHRDRKICI